MLYLRLFTAILSIFRKALYPFSLAPFKYAISPLWILRISVEKSSILVLVPTKFLACLNTANFFINDVNLFSIGHSHLLLPNLVTQFFHYVPQELLHNSESFQITFVFLFLQSKNWYIILSASLFHVSRFSVQLLLFLYPYTHSLIHLFMIPNHLMCRFT